MGKSKKAIFNLFELVIVLLLGFGLFWYSSIPNHLNDSSPSTKALSSYYFYFLVFIEVVLLALISSFLQFRRWTLNEFNLSFNWSMPAIALILVVCRYALGTLFTYLFRWVGLNLDEPIHLQMEASFVSCLMIIVVNSVYEEVLLLGYLFKRLEKLSPVLIIIISMVIRESYHLYQGWYKLPMATSIGVVYGWYYYKYKKLWPPIIAHGITNTLAFLSLNYHLEWLNW